MQCPGAGIPEVDRIERVFYSGCGQPGGGERRKFCFTAVPAGEAAGFPQFHGRLWTGGAGDPAPPVFTETTRYSGLLHMGVIVDVLHAVAVVAVALGAVAPQDIVCAYAQGHPGKWFLSPRTAAPGPPGQGEVRAGFGPQGQGVPPAEKKEAAFPPCSPIVPPCQG